VTARPLVLAALLAAPCAASPGVEVTLVESPRGVYRLDGEFTVDAATATAWAVVTDYDRIEHFVSSIESSRILRRDADGAVVEQVGRGKFLFFSRRAKLTLDVREKGPGRLEFRRISGPEFLGYEGSWTVSPSMDGCIVEYALRAEPAPGVAPKFAAKRVLRKTVQGLLDEVRAEILRRRRPEL
jgi:ribosome-associated toxin RatA of RatAB toxin-antitoxin module